MTIYVKIDACNDSERKTVNTIYYSATQFNEEREFAKENWKKIQGEYAVINEDGVNLHLTVKKSKDYETWTVTEIED